MTVLFSVNTEKVRLRRETVPEVYGELEDAEQPGLQPRRCQAAADGGRAVPGGGWALPLALPRARPLGGKHPAPPNPTRCIRTGCACGAALATATQLLDAKGIKSWTKNPGVIQGRGAQRGLPAALSATFI